MGTYLVRRLLWVVPTVLCVATIVFFLIRLGAGDPAQAILGTYASSESLEAFRTAMGLDQPLVIQYGRYLSQLLQGNLGSSLITGESVSNQLLVVLPYTLDLTIGGILLGLILGIPLGILMALRHSTWLDSAGRVLSLFGISMPAFFLGILLLMLFAVRLDWFPVSGGGNLANLPDRLYHLALPAGTLGLVMTAYITRTTRASMLNVLTEDYVRTARAKGIREEIVIVRHALRNALLPVVTVCGMYATILLAISPLVEIVFGRPGLGRLILGAIKQSDYTVLQSVMLIYAGFVVVINLIVDLSYSVIDPRIRYH
jgi:ABC-type dipeptide/oligopeptide/nickel transport system permease component